MKSIQVASKALGKRNGENPARWRGHVDKILPKRDRARKVKHHSALPYTGIPGFMAELAARQAPAARVLRLLILTCVRTSEALLARCQRRLKSDPPGPHHAAAFAPARVLVCPAFRLSFRR